MKSRSLIGKILKILAGIVGAGVGAFIMVVIILTILEYRPDDVENIEISGEFSKGLSSGDSVNLLTWNLGYGALGKTADFFMDGGKSVASSSKDEVEANVKAFSDEISEVEPDLVLLQEVDVDSKRSHHINEVEGIKESIEGYQDTFATNYKVAYVPYPFPPIGKVDCGLATFSKYEVSESKRYALPNPFKYPFKLANLKRCLMVDRIPLDDSDKELVVVNLHLEAYDSGEGKIAQTKLLKELLESEEEKGNYVIAGGDFNQSFSNIDISNFPITSEDLWAPGQIDVSEFDGFSFVMDNSLPSCRSLDRPYDKSADFQYYLIDGFIVSDNITVNSINTQDLEFENSDHNPVLLNITLE